MKKRYVGAYISFFNNNLIMSEVMADNEKEAITEVFIANTFSKDDEKYIAEEREYLKPLTSEEIRERAFDSDSMVNVKEVVNKITRTEYLNLLEDKLTILKNKCKNKYYLETIIAEDGATIMVNHTHDGITVEKTTEGIRRSLHLTDRPFRYKEHTQNRDFLIDYMNDIIESDVEEVMMYLGQII